MSDSIYHYTEERWDPETLAEVVVSARFNLDPDPKLLDKLKRLTSLLPPDQFTLVDRNTLVHLIYNKDPSERKTFDERQKEAYKRIESGDFIDDDAELVFGFRTKIDKNIRRTRLRDVCDAYKYEGNMAGWSRNLSMVSSLDYIHVTNLLLADLIYDYSFLSLFHVTHNLNSLDDYTTAAKLLNDHLKKYPAPMSLRLQFAEAGTLSGYRNPPFPGFDYFSEVKKLATGGNEHGLVTEDWNTRFERLATAASNEGKARQVQWMSLEEFIASDLWTTAGSSSIGTVEWKYKDEKGHFKARKNFVQDLYAVQTLFKDTLENIRKQKNKTIIKSELGKIRLAVASDIYTYLVMAWLNYLTGSPYLNWSETVISETYLQTFTRVSKMINNLKNQYSLPYDYAAFDHQPTTWQIQTMVRCLFSRGKGNVPQSSLSEWSDALTTIVKAFDDAELVGSHDGETLVLKVQGGLMSGLFVTSQLGNMWNKIMTRAAQEICEDLNVGHTDYSAILKGDDSAIMENNYWQCLMTRLGYQSINAIGANGKFGIHRGNSEFLRVWYNSKRCYGYPNRIIPGLVQRKPWNSDPWTEEATIEHVFGALRIVERRLDKAIPTLEVVYSRMWSRLRHRTTDWLRLPKWLGGLGLLPWKGSIPLGRYPKLKLDGLEQTNVHPEALDRIRNQFSKYALSHDEAVELYQSRFRSKMTADDIPSVNGLFRKEFNSQSKDIAIGWSKMSLFGSSADIPNFVQLMALNVGRDLRSVVDVLDVKSSFGEHRQYASVWRELSELAQVRKIRPWSLFRSICPDVAGRIKYLERHGLHRTDAMDWVFGSYSAQFSDTNLSPQNSTVVNHLSEYTLDYNMKASRIKTREDWVRIRYQVETTVVNTVRMAKVHTQLFTY